MPVVSLVERGGKIRSFVTADVTAANVGRILAENVSRDSTTSAKNISIDTLQRSISDGTPGK